VAREVTFEGEGCRFTLGVVRYEFHEDAHGAEANWLKGGVRVELSETGAFRCSVPVLLMADELSYFRDDLGRVLARQKGVASLDTEEDCVSISVAVARDRCTLSGYVKSSGFAQLEFWDIESDEASLRQSHGQLVELVREFPVRESAAG
jgi:RNA recognition motif-containing protein